MLENSIFLWARECQRPDERVSATRRMADNRVKTRCPECRAGNAGHRQVCPVWPGVLGSTAWTRSCILDELHIYTPNTLAAILAACNSEYWNEAGDLTLPDTDYDLVMRQLEALCPEHPQLRCVGAGDGTGYVRIDR